MGVSQSEVRHVAMLARIGLEERRVDELARELSSILRHMEVLRRVNTEGAPEAAGIGAAGMRLREDQGPPIPLSEPPSAFAPAMRDGLFTVPRLATHEDPEPAA